MALCEMPEAMRQEVLDAAGPDGVVFHIQPQEKS